MGTSDVEKEVIIKVNQWTEIRGITVLKEGDEGFGGGSDFLPEKILEVRIGKKITQLKNILHSLASL